MWAAEHSPGMGSRPRARRGLLRAGGAAAIVLALGASGCGSEAIKLSRSNPYYHGAVLFRDHCSGCHTLSIVGANGSATNIKNRVGTNGPNFNIRNENAEQVLYAIRNGGFSGAIMPENIVLGQDAKAVAQFLAQYSGHQKQKGPSASVSAAVR